MIGSPISCRFAETYSKIDEMHKNYLKAFPFDLDLFFSSQDYSYIFFQDYSYICADPEALKATLRRLDRLAGKKVVITNIFHCLVYLTKSQESFWFCFETLRGASNLF